MTALVATLLLAAAPAAAQEPDAIQGPFVEVSHWNAVYDNAEKELARVLVRWEGERAAAPAADSPEAGLVRGLRAERGVLSQDLQELRFLDAGRRELVDRREALAREWESWRKVEATLVADEEAIRAQAERSWRDFLALAPADEGGRAMERARRAGAKWWEARAGVDWPAVFRNQDDVPDPYEARANTLRALGERFREEAAEAGSRPLAAAEDVLRVDGQVWLASAQGEGDARNLYSARMALYRHRAAPPSDADALADLDAQIAQIDEQVTALETRIRERRKQVRSLEDQLGDLRAAASLRPPETPDVYAQLHALDADYTRLWDGMNTLPLDVDQERWCKVLVHGALTRVLLEKVDAPDLLDVAATSRDHGCRATAMELRGLAEFQWAWADALRRASEQPNVVVAVFADGGRWSVDGLNVYGAGPVRVRLAQGTHRLQVRGEDGRIHQAVEDVRRGQGLGFSLGAGGLTVRATPGLEAESATPIVLETCPAPAAEAARRPLLVRAGPWLALGLGAGLLATGGGLLVDTARLDQSAAEELNPGLRAEIEQRADIQRAIGFAAAGMGVPVSGVSVYLLVPRHDREVTVPVLGVGGAW